MYNPASTSLDGLLIINKPAGITSAKALYRLRKLTGQRKSGHAGTLDPAATGVLIICLGKATKLVERLMDLPKVYRAEARLDVTSASFDSDEPLIQVPLNRIPAERVPVEHGAAERNATDLVPTEREATDILPTQREVRAAFAAFVGTIEQVPPALSAIKVGGRPAYKLARRGAPVELKPRPVRIDRIDVLEYRWPAVTFEMQCGRGTYVRSLIRDVGTRLRTGGCLVALERLAVGPFHVREALRLEESQVGPDVIARVLSMERVEEMLSAAATRKG
ncbi:MAG: tRNA pseudouridine(55) synthase TruB [Phycisphaerales bacterium]|nr:tRNA pseudouridine(55) synthase TruB [Phycisphaerales bacterium]